MFATGSVLMKPPWTSPGILAPVAAGLAALAATAVITAPAPDGTVSAAPGPAGPQSALESAQLPGGQLANAYVELVVKFKDDREVKEICDLFWKDRAGARARFEAFKAGRPEFGGLSLDRVTYSNELVLTPTDEVAAHRRLPAAREIAARLSARPNIAYAEPNLAAHPSGEN